MQIYWMKTFITLCEQKSFSSAADELYVSQSTVSKNIQSIEKAVGSKLIDRSGRSIKLTEAGELFLSYATKIVAEYDEMTEKFSLYTRNKLNTFHVAMTPVASLHGCSDLVYKYAKENPDLNIIVDEMEMGAVVRALREGTTDIALTRTNLYDCSGYKTLDLTKEELYLVCAKSNPIAKRDKVSVKSLGGIRLVFNKYSFDDILILLQKYGVSREHLLIQATTMHNEVLAQYLARGQTASIMTSHFVKQLTDMTELVMIPFEEPLELDFGIIVRKWPIPKAFLNLLSMLQTSYRLEYDAVGAVGAVGFAADETLIQ